MRYRDYPHQGQQCQGCTMFKPPNRCTLVRGSIDKHGYCIQFDPKRGWKK